MTARTYKVLHLAGGIGGGTIGFQRANATFRGVTGSFRTLTSVDVDEAICRDYGRLTGAKPTCADLHEMTPSELLAACGGEYPDVVFTSPPCTGFSGLLGEAKSKTEKYQKLNSLVTKSLFLTCEAFKADLPALILLENVPRIQQRGADLLDQVERLLSGYGYAIARTTHDCGELGGMGQHRPRFLLVARLVRKVPNFLYQPPKLPLKTIGDVIGPLPLPEDPACGPLHRLPKLQMKTWMRLALIPAGGDWRDLPGMEGKPDYKTYGVVRMDDTSGPITSKAAPGSGPFSVADPRWFNNVWGVKRFDEVGATVTGGHGPSSGAQNVADTRTDPATKRFNNVMRIVRFDETSVAVTGGATPTSGGVNVADPRLGCRPRNGAYGVQRFDATSSTIIGSANLDNSAASIADPRAFLAAMLRDESQPNPPPLIIAEDGTWHRPLTTFELAALQTLPLWMPDGSPLTLDGDSQSAWRMRIGNMVPPDAAQAIAEAMLRCLLAAEQGAWTLSSEDVWVLPEQEAEAAG